MKFTTTTLICGKIVIKFVSSQHFCITVQILLHMAAFEKYTTPKLTDDRHF